ncbi:hypothetical protein FOS14_03440 [Skermania sp. ID1734]|uniref:hypothetical protein n=1 Tax=Skermania sp. ID1734 TaxID=2597516 RepID=UPI001180A21D|nr:hypothetical protein [Skermania sp. ID1734]TSE01599.1 hypothetical protein FOS14_03440 [Skermania sp. ID1734]
MTKTVVLGEGQLAEAIASALGCSPVATTDEAIANGTSVIVIPGEGGLDHAIALIEAQKNVVLVGPLSQFADDTIEQIDSACRRNGVSFHATDHSTVLIDRIGATISQMVDRVIGIEFIERGTAFELKVTGAPAAWRAQIGFDRGADTQAATVCAVVDAAAAISSAPPGVIVEDAQPRYRMDDRV